ncbi:recombinase family protein [Streptomyces platensis]|uniref:recombinase family protein n=1 Tax=Streptomyces platensis TaxID=58346 RepID=UPI001F33F477|nr:recombinase family protein [Streptomyces platensis]MCF3142549.1 hypothetical protein [Streptomyces platensis]
MSTASSKMQRTPAPACAGAVREDLPGERHIGLQKRKVINADGAIDWIVLRPEFRQLLADLAHGVIDGVIFYTLTGLSASPGISKTSSTSSNRSNGRSPATGGRMNLINDSDRRMARRCA